jgi:signal transduction histidine kinase
LVQFFPDSIQPILPDAPIQLDAIRMDTSNLNLDMGPLLIPNKADRLQFYVSSPYFGNLYNQDLEYIVRGLDSNWYPLEDNGTIEFNKLPKGNYDLLVRKKAGFGENRFIVKEIPFTVEPAVYETWIFRGLLLLALSALLILLIRVRVRYLVNQKKKLEKEVLDRTRELNVLIENLEATVKELEHSREQLYQHSLFIEKLTMIIAHDLRSPLRFLYDATKRLNKKIFEEQSYNFGAMSSEIQKTTGNIFNFVEDFSWWLSSMARSFRIQKTSVDLNELLMELKMFFSEFLKANGNSMTLSVDGPLKVHSDRQLLKIILRNVIDNANKHTVNGQIEITAQSSDQSCFIRVSDDGKGMTSETLEKIKQRILGEDFPRLEKESGYGFRFIIDFCKLLDIKLGIESRTGEGTKIVLDNFRMLTASPFDPVKIIDGEEKLAE